MAGEFASSSWRGTEHQSDGPKAGAPVFPTQPQACARTRPAVALAGAAMVVAIAALIVALTRPTAMRPVTTRTPPMYSAAEVSSAQHQLCDTYKLGARAVQVDTNGHVVALGRIALTNAAAMLDDAAANPVLSSTYRDPPRALAASYRQGTAMGNRDIATDAQFQAALDDINAKDAAMKKACEGG